MKNTIVKSVLGIGVLSLALSGAAYAGGLERSSQDFDILFEEGHAFEAGVTFVAPQRKYKNIRGSFIGGATGGINPNNGQPYSTSVEESKDYFVPKVSAKFAFHEDAACAGQFRTPFGAHTDVGMDTVAMYGSIEQEIKSRDYGLNCSYRFNMGKGYLRLLGGVSYQEVEGQQTKFLLAGTPGSFPVPLNRIGKLDVDDSGIGWRAGLAYEIPEIALRTSLTYQSKIDYRLEGTIENLAPFTIPVYGDATVPQSVEWKVQSGIAPGWLAFGSIKWTDWSVIQSIGFRNKDQLGPVTPGGVEITSLDLYYRDGWTISGGVGHKINDQFSVAGSVAWDRGTTTGLNSQTDTWTFGLGGSYTPTKNFEIRAGGALGILTSGTKDDRVIDGDPNLTGFVADFGNDLVSALSISAKLKF